MELVRTLKVKVKKLDSDKDKLGNIVARAAIRFKANKIKSVMDGDDIKNGLFTIMFFKVY